MTLRVFLLASLVVMASKSYANGPADCCGGPPPIPVDQCQVPCEPPCPPQATNQAAIPQAAAYAAPPQTGSFQGATQSYGIEGAAIHFPALSFRLPTIQLPSFARFRSNARMHIDSAQAPYTALPNYGVAAGYANVTTQGVQQYQQHSATAASASVREAAAEAAAAEAEKKLQDLSEKERLLNEKMRKLEECLRQLQQFQAANQMLYPATRTGVQPPAEYYQQPPRALPRVTQSSYEEPIGQPELLRRLPHVNHVMPRAVGSGYYE